MALATQVLLLAKQSDTKSFFSTEDWAPAVEFWRRLKRGTFGTWISGSRWKTVVTVKEDKREVKMSRMSFFQRLISIGVSE